MVWIAAAVREEGERTAATAQEFLLRFVLVATAILGPGVDSKPRSFK